jgi:hypothetical protein
MPLCSLFEMCSKTMFLLWLAASISCVLAQNNNDTCTIDGQTFERGENLGDAYVTLCGSAEEYPCFCNPGLENEMECPYCGFVTGDGDLYCGKDEQFIAFPDGSIVRNCSCVIPEDPTENPIRECTIIDDDSSGPTEPGCEFPGQDGDLIFFGGGDSFGDLIEGVCGPATEWPSYCLAAEDGGGDFDIEYPYCVFDDAAAGEIVCAINNQTITYENEDGDQVTCACVYSQEEGPQPSCKTRPDSPSSTPAPDASTPSPVEPRPEEVTPTTAPDVPTASAISSTWGLGLTGSIILACSILWN